MIKSPFHKISLLFLLVVCSISVWGQGGVRVQASVDRNRILIGEHITLKLEADIPETEAIRFFTIDSIPHFEFLDIQPIDTSNTSEGTVLTQIIRMTSFDSGHWVIPRFELDANFSTDSIPMDVGFTSPFDPNQPYHDVKDVLDVEIEEEKETWWWYAAAGGVLLLLLLYLLLRKKPVPVQQAAPPVNPLEEAMTALDKLQSAKHPPKEYYSALVDIFRVYVARRKGISSLQKTTDDLVVQLRSLPIPKDDFDRLAQALRLSDFVKFAKYIPEAQDDKTSLHSVKTAIKAIDQIN